MSIDLHVHTAFSDGTDTPSELIENLKHNSIRTFAVCDHDTTEGCRTVAPIVPNNMQFIHGIEFSCKTEFKRCHILGLGIDIDHSQIITAVEEGRKLRAAKLQSRLNHLKETHNIVFESTEIEDLQKLNSVGKPHIARLLVKYGYAKDIDEAIKRFLTFRGNNDRLDADFAIEAIKASGGTAIWAHPLGGEGEKRLTSDEFEEQLQLLIEAGIEGLECYYSRYTSDEANFLVSNAKQNNLLISGGSDYHGANKNIRLGELSADNSSVSEHDLTVLTDRKVF